MSYNPTSARNALRLLQLAHDQWVNGLKALRGTKITEETRDQALKLYGYAFTMLLLSRGLDDMCRGRAAYDVARDQASALLGAARYAANRAVHQLANLSQPVGAITAPLVAPIAADKLAYLRWVPEAYLPSLEEERDNTQRKLRSCYVELFAGRDMSPALEQLRRWFEEQVANLES